MKTNKLNYFLIALLLAFVVNVPIACESSDNSPSIQDEQQQEKEEEEEEEEEEECEVGADLDLSVFNGDVYTTIESSFTTQEQVKATVGECGVLNLEGDFLGFFCSIPASVPVQFIPTDATTGTVSIAESTVYLCEAESQYTIIAEGTYDLTEENAVFDLVLTYPDTEDPNTIVTIEYAVTLASGLIPPYEPSPATAACNGEVDPSTYFTTLEFYDEVFEETFFSVGEAGSESCSLVLKGNTFGLLFCDADEDFSGNGPAYADIALELYLIPSENDASVGTVIADEQPHDCPETASNYIVIESGSYDMNAGTITLTYKQTNTGFSEDSKTAVLTISE